MGSGAQSVALLLSLTLYPDSSRAWSCLTPFASLRSLPFSPARIACSADKNSMWSKHSRKHRPVRMTASSDDEMGPESIELFTPTLTTSTCKDLIEIGLFPMIIDDEYIDGSVLVPGGKMPLNIFAMKYRSLFARMIEGKEKAGMIYCDGRTKKYATVGTLIEIEYHKNLPDGRMTILCGGRQRFRIHDMVRSETDETYSRVRVEMIDDEPDSNPTETAALEQNVWRLLDQVLNQTNRLHGTSLDLKSTLKQLAPQPAPPQSLPRPWEWYAADPSTGLTPSLRQRIFSFEVAVVLSCSAADLQLMLQSRSTMRRLEQQRRLLDEASKLLSARLSLKDVSAG